MSQLPVGWVAIKLGDIATFYKGKGISKKDITSEGLDCIRYGELFTSYNEIITTIYSKTNITKDMVYSKINDTLMPTSDVTPTGLATASALNKEGVILGGDILIIRSAQILNSYLSYFIRSHKKDIMKLVSGSTVYHIYANDMKKLKIPLPPLQEQKKIAEILSTVDQKIGFVDIQIKQTETLKKGLMQKLLTEGIGHTEFKDSEIGRIPVGWKVVEMGKIADILDPHPSHRAPKEDSAGYPFVGIGDISESGEIKISSSRKVSLEDVLDQNKNISINENDIGFGRVATVGKIIKFKSYDFPFALSPTMAVIKTKEINNSFLYQFLSSNVTKSQFKNFTSGSTRISLGIQNLRKLLISFPPLGEQKQISKILSTTDKKLETLREKKEAYDELKKGLMQKLLTGEVRV